MFCHNLLGTAQMLDSIDVFYFQACSAIFTLLPAYQLMVFVIYRFLILQHNLSTVSGSPAWTVY